MRLLHENFVCLFSNAMLHRDILLYPSFVPQSRHTTTNQPTQQTYLYHGMGIVAPEHEGHGRGRRVRFACQEGGRIGSIKSLHRFAVRNAFKQNHLFRFALGMQIRDNFQRRTRLDERHFHVETAQIDAQKGTGVHSMWVLQ